MLEEEEEEVMMIEEEVVEVMIEEVVAMEQRSRACRPAGKQRTWSATVSETKGLAREPWRSAASASLWKRSTEKEMHGLLPVLLRACGNRACEPQRRGQRWGLSPEPSRLGASSTREPTGSCGSGSCPPWRSREKVAPLSTSFESGSAPSTPAALAASCGESGTEIVALEMTM